MGGGQREEVSVRGSEGGESTRDESGVGLIGERDS